MEDIDFELDTNIIVALLVIFVILKVTRLVAWSWWWIFSPLWLPLVLAILIVGISKFVLLFKKSEDDGERMLR